MQLIVYPNPNAGKFYIELSGSKAKSQEIELFNSSGDLVCNTRLDHDITKLIDLTGIESGDYSLNLTSDRFEIHTKITIKNSNDIADNSSILELALNSFSSN
jgi:Secretion system C-terminal sorting domain